METLDLHLAPERLDAVAETDESGPFGEVGSTNSVVLNRNAEVRSLGVDTHVHLGRVRMLGRVRKCF